MQEGSLVSAVAAAVRYAACREGCSITAHSSTVETRSVDQRAAMQCKAEQVYLTSSSRFHTVLSEQMRTRLAAR